MEKDGTLDEYIYARISYVGFVDQVGLDVAVIAFESKHGAAAHPGGGGRILQRPFERRPRHPRLIGSKDRIFQINPLPIAGAAPSRDGRVTVGRRVVLRGHC